MPVFEQLVIVQYVTTQSSTSGVCVDGTGTNQSACAADGGDWEGTITLEEEERDYTIDLETISSYGPGVDTNGDENISKTTIFISGTATPKMLNETLQQFRSRMAKAGF